MATCVHGRRHRTARPSRSVPLPPAPRPRYGFGQPFSTTSNSATRVLETKSTRAFSRSRSIRVTLSADAILGVGSSVVERAFLRSGDFVHANGGQKVLYHASRDFISSRFVLLAGSAKIAATSRASSRPNDHDTVIVAADYIARVHDFTADDDGMVDAAQGFLDRPFHAETRTENRETPSSGWPSRHARRYR